MQRAMKILSILVPFVVCVFANAQTTTENYVKTITARQAYSGSLSDKNASTQTQQQVQYVDGLGRPRQSVIRWGSPSNSDIITPVTYDQFGRQPKSYLPYPAAQSTSHYRANAVTEQTNDCITRYGAEDGGVAYSETRF